MDTIQLFCFPFAGGSKYSYKAITSLAPTGIEVIALEPPGRGARLAEALLTDLEAMADDAFGQWLRHRDEQKPYALYGHSMGATMAHLVCQRIRQAKLPLPCGLLLSGRPGPTACRSSARAAVHALPQPEFLAEVQKLGGMPPEVADNHPLIDFFEPILRADFQALETYHYPPTLPLSVPIAVLIGMQEKVTLDEAGTWEYETLNEFEVKQFPGHHFFINQHPHRVMEWMVRKLYSGLCKNCTSGRCDRYAKHIEHHLA